MQHHLRNNHHEPPRSAVVILEPTAETETLIWEREWAATCHPIIAQSKSKLVKQSTLVKYSNLVKDWSN